MAGELDGPIGLALRRVAAALGPPGDGGPDPGALADRLAEELDGAVGRLSMAIRRDRARVAGWPEPTVDVDVAVRGRLAGRLRAVIGCSRWDGEEGPGAAVRQACALASASRDGGGDAYLVAAAPTAAWDAGGPGAALFEDGERATLPLLRDTGVARPAGDGPARVPGRLRTSAVARAALPGGAWELRAARVAGGGGDLEAG